MDATGTLVGTLTSFKVLLALFLASLPSLINYVDIIQTVADETSQFNTDDHKENTFDFIIVGGGAAGCVLANRLSTNPNNKVLLLERGGDPLPFTQVPILSRPTFFTESSAIGYKYLTTNQTALQQQSYLIMTGRGLGGCTNINGLVYTRGSPQIYDKWAEMTQDPVWRYSNVLKAFKSVEDYHGYYTDPIDLKYHSVGGEMYVGNGDRDAPNVALDYFFKAASSAGFSEIDVNSGDKQARIGGYTHVDFNIKQGQRWSTYKAFLQPILSRPNLKVIRYAQVTKIHLNNEHKVTGVEYTRHGQTRFAYARREVIVSAGTFHSAQLLMLSGIGPKEELKRIGVPLKVDLPVGAALLDHFGLGLTFSINKTLLYYFDRDATLQDTFNYISTGTGNFAWIQSDTAAIFTKSSNSRVNYPNLELIFGNLLALPQPSDPSRDYFSLSTTVVAPQSSGTVTLRSRHPTDEPIVNPNYLTNRNDIDATMQGIELSLSLLESSPDFQAVDLQIVPVPACASFQFKSPAYWKCHVKNAGFSEQHPTGSCPMGKVVDSRLKVLGVRGLRVIDASVMPLIPNAHTATATVMIATMGASFVLDDSRFDANRQSG